MVSEKVTTCISRGVSVHCHDCGPVVLTDWCGGHIALTSEAADKLLMLLLARKAAQGAD